MKKIIKKFLVIIILLSLAFLKDSFAASSASDKGFNNVDNLKCEFELENDIHESKYGNEASFWYGVYSYLDMERDKYYFISLSWMELTPDDFGSIDKASQTFNFSMEPDKEDSTLESDLSCADYGPVNKMGSYSTSSRLSFEFDISNGGLNIKYDKSRTYTVSDRPYQTFRRNNYKDLLVEYDLIPEYLISQSTNDCLAFNCLVINNYSKHFDITMSFNFIFNVNFYSNKKIEKNFEASYKLHCSGGKNGGIIDNGSLNPGINIRE